MTCSLADVFSRHAGWPLVLWLSMVRCIETLTWLEVHFSVWVNSSWSFSLWHPLQYRHRSEGDWCLMDPCSGTVILEWFSIHLWSLLVPVVSLYRWREGALLAPVGKNERRKQPFMEEVKLFRRSQPIFGSWNSFRKLPAPTKIYFAQFSHTLITSCFWGEWDTCPRE